MSGQHSAPMAIRDPDGSTRWTTSITNDADDIGHMIAEGFLEEEMRWPTLADAYFKRFTTAEHQLLELRQRSEELLVRLLARNVELRAANTRFEATSYAGRWQEEFLEYMS